MTARNIESLHTHTTLSDGKLSQQELFQLAESLGISVLAFTDHDAVPSPEIMRGLDTLRDGPTKWIIGTELTAGLPEELAPETGTAHIIGLFVDPSNQKLLDHCARAQQSRVKRMTVIVSNLQNLGFTITTEDCLEASAGDSVGRPHIVEALSKHFENNVIMEKIRREMAADAAHDPLIQEHYTRMMQKDARQYPYTLLLSPHAYRKAYAEHTYMPDLDQAVALIRDAGGVAIMAHYFTIRSKISFEVLEQLLAGKRLDGVEVVYGFREYNTDGEQTLERERQALRDLAAKHGAIITGGSDAHTREDLETYAENGWFSSESVGFTERVLSTGKVSKKFSSLE